METVKINDTEIPVRAYMHRTAENCVTAAYGGDGATTYENPRKLIDWEDAIDQVGWLEHGIAEWRAYAVEAGAQNVKLRAEVAALTRQRDDLLAALEEVKGLSAATAAPIIDAAIASVKGGAA